MSKQATAVTPRLVPSPAGRIHLVEQGTGPLVLLVHGFPKVDASTTWMADAIKAYPHTLPGLVSSRILDGCGHWIQQERPAEINRLLVDWLASLPA